MSELFQHSWIPILGLSVPEVKFVRSNKSPTWFSSEYLLRWTRKSRSARAWIRYNVSLRFLIARFLRIKSSISNNVDVSVRCVCPSVNLINQIILEFKRWSWESHWEYRRRLGRIFRGVQPRKFMSMLILFSPTRVDSFSGGIEQFNLHI